MSADIDLGSIGVDKQYKTLCEAQEAQAGTYHDRVADQPEDAKGPVGLPMGTQATPYKITGSTGTPPSIPGSK